MPDNRAAVTEEPVESASPVERSVVDGAARGPGWRRPLSRLVSFQESRTLAVLIVLVIVFSILKSSFTSSGNIVTIVTISAILGIVTLGQTVVLISGGFDLSVGGVVPLAGVIFALLATHGFSFPVALVLTVLMGVVVGTINAVVIGRLRVNALIATLGMLSITGGLAYILAHGQTVSLPSAAGVLGNSSPLWDLPWFVWVMVLLAIVVDVLLRFTVPGRLIYSVGGNIEACRVAGIRVEGVRVLAYSISGALAAVAGICYASQLLAAQGAIGASSTLDSLTAAVLGGAALIGGIGSAPGAILGVFIIGSILDGLTLLHVQSFYEQIVSGAVLIAAVALTSLRARSR